MVISTTVYVEHPGLALVPTIQSVPDVSIGVVSDAGTDPHHAVHHFWVETSDFDAFEAALAADHTVASFGVVAANGTRRTYRIEYSDAAQLVSPVVAEAGGLILETFSEADGWVLTLQLQDRSALYELERFAEADDAQLEVRELHEVENDEVDSEFGLTEPQIEALVNAYLQGYYDEPRETSFEELGALLGISQTAVSGRIRRGSARLIEATLVDDESD